MGYLLEFLGRPGQAVVAQRQEARRLYGVIGELAPQCPNGINYASSTLAGIFRERAGSQDGQIPDELVNTLGFAEGDNLKVYFTRFPPTTPDALWLQRQPQADRIGILTFDHHTFQLTGIQVQTGGQLTLETSRKSPISRDQRAFVGVLQAIHDDLVDGRAGWINGARLARAAWVGEMSRPFAESQRPIPRVDGMLQLITNTFADENFMVVGGSPDSAGNDGSGSIRLYTTLNINERAAIKMASSFSLYNRDDNEITYSRNLRAHAGQVRVRFGDGMDITLGTFSPDIRRSRNEERTPYLEPQFADFLAGKGEAFSFEGDSDTSSERVRGALLLRHRNTFGGRTLFETGLETPTVAAVAS